MSKPKSDRTIISLDVMGGDHAPKEQIQGAVSFLADPVSGNSTVVLVGDEHVIQQILDDENSPQALRERCPVLHASQIIGMEDSPVKAIRGKKDASIVVAMQLVRNGHAHAVVSAGNTGAAAVAAKILLKSLPSIERPAIAVTFPREHGYSILLDAGANAECKPKHLFQFAAMGSAYAQTIFDIRVPRVGLLSIGEEQMKGNDLTRDTHKLLTQSSLRFIGNVEGRDIFSDTVDVIICDGFVGNIVLKSSESLVGSLARILKKEIKKSLLARMGLMLMLPVLKKIKGTLDHAEYGGAPLLGVNGNCLICHGSSDAFAIKNALRAAKNMVERDLNKQILNTLNKVT